MATFKATTKPGDGVDATPIVIGKFTGKTDQEGLTGQGRHGEIIEPRKNITNAQIGELRPEMGDRYYVPNEDPSNPAVQPGPVSHVDRPLPQGTSIPQTGIQSIPAVFTSQKPYRIMSIRTVLLYAAAPVRIDSGLGNRIEIAIHNIGDFDIWFNVKSGTAVENFAEVIPGSPTVGEPLGGYWSAFLGSDIQLWGIAEVAAGAAAVRIVVSEFAF